MARKAYYDRYTTIKIRKELGELLDEWIEMHPELKLYGLDSRSGAIQFIVTRLVIQEGLIEESEINLG